MTMHNVKPVQQPLNQPQIVEFGRLQLPILPHIANRSSLVTKASCTMASSSGPRQVKNIHTPAVGSTVMNLQTISPTDNFELPLLTSRRVKSNQDLDTDTLHPQPADKYNVRFPPVDGSPHEDAKITSGTAKTTARGDRTKREQKRSNRTASAVRTKPIGNSDEAMTAIWIESRNNPLRENKIEPEAEFRTFHSPLSPSDARHTYGHLLTDYEKFEITDYREIWYAGSDAKVKGVHGTAQNSGYDDEQGSYIKIMGDHLAYRYEMVELLGKGSFGQVVKAFDHKTEQYVAIKIIRNKKRFHHQSAVEMNILEALKKHDRFIQSNIVYMIDSFHFRNHFCIVFELLGKNLYQVMKNNKYQGFGMQATKYLVRSIVDCLRLLYNERVIHCDLKPENILVREENRLSIKVIDFGSSCYEDQRVYTYIQSRFYRAPEVILGAQYSTAIDMWSLGCVAVELHTGYPLFPGENESAMVASIVELIGLPSCNFLEACSRRQLYFDSSGLLKSVTNSKGKLHRTSTKDLSKILRSSDTQFIDFITRCLVWNPSERMTPNEAIQHAWLRETKLDRPKVSTRGRRSTSIVSRHSASKTRSTNDSSRVNLSTVASSSSSGESASSLTSFEMVSGLAMTTRKTVSAEDDSGIYSGFLPTI